MKKLLAVCLCVCLACAAIGCGKKNEEEQNGQAETKKTTTEDKDLEKVTELETENDTITFGEIESGLNFKAKGNEVTFQFQDMDQFDNSLTMAFSLTDAESGEAPEEMVIKEGKEEYTFKNLKKGNNYYLEVYPTESADSDEEFQRISDSNSGCKLIVKQ